MPEPRNIWMQAIRASQELALDKRKGESVFIQLLHTNPKDGMIYYERGEAYEYLGEYSLAESDYTAASEFFFAEHWREVARQALARIRSKIHSENVQTTQEIKWQLFHIIHTLPYLDYEIRSDAISAYIRMNSEPHSMAMTLRSCLESLVLTLLDANNISYSEDDDLVTLIKLLEKWRIIPITLRHQMDEIRRLGNKAAHPRKRRRFRSFTPSAVAFIQVAKWANDHFRIKKVNNYS